MNADGAAVTGSRPGTAGPAAATDHLGPPGHRRTGSLRPRSAGTRLRLEPLLRQCAALRV
ncbi:hypothetical protein QR97_20485 [Streptomyces sp. PBH53]|nr:hypothetical protein QR97_20485 [Streptomyces sp. PBH53]